MEDCEHKGGFWTVAYRYVCDTCYQTEADTRARLSEERAILAEKIVQAARTVINCHLDSEFANKWWNDYRTLLAEYDAAQDAKVQNGSQNG